MQAGAFFPLSTRCCRKEPAWKAVKDCGVASDRNARFRRTMEDAHAAMDELCGPGTAYFAVYDGHGGRGAVNFVQEHLHANFREQVELGLEVAEAWKAAFLKVAQKGFVFLFLV